MAQGKKIALNKALLYCVFLMTVAGLAGNYHYGAQKGRERAREAAAQAMVKKFQDLKPALEHREAELEEWLRLNASSPGGDYLSKLLPDRNFTFRGHDFGQTVDEVKAGEAGRPDSLLSPVSEIWPERHITYLYYLQDGEMGGLVYNFSSAERLESIMIVIEGTAGEPEAVPALEELVPAFGAVLGTLRKHSDYTYEWSAPGLKSFLFAFPAHPPAESIAAKLVIVYASPASALKVDANELRAEIMKSESAAREVLNRADGEERPRETFKRVFGF